MKRLASIFFLAVAASLSAADEHFLGNWAFELPDGNPAWLQINYVENKFEGKLLWSVGSAKPVSNLLVLDSAIVLTRKLKWKPFGEEPQMLITKPISGKIVSGKLEMTVTQSSAGSDEEETFQITGKRLPAIPPRPDLSKVVFGEPIDLLAKGMDGWRLTNPKKKNGWRIEEGVLINETPKKDFAAYGSYGNLRTVRDFEDFELTIEYNVEKAANSGVYLRGMYEAQVVDRDSRMQGIQGPGAIFGRIAPSENAGNPGGEWNRYRLTLVKRHITVELNGKKVIDNQPLAGCTGGGISADDTKPGPIFLQGDHTSVRYRNIQLRPVLPKP